ncbi:peptidylprolyl isomerase [Aliiglaciecola sp. CAU 1673]|uniref:peptidylprolyl isomerase n=1 Tax=Aliiglaciecola sp. CAU 1673 TaxID=3032595 RepID=UPI0023DAC086|nr:peptidylprolyl isomerase [Aliiglaciecola sp. CAU 1673]MDF2176681.1 peptidylprolyl isomerase [Aliiglaciecola sp. CAU 1673]
MAKYFVLLIGVMGFTSGAWATVVEFRTVLGSFQVQLFDQHTPKTVQNFLGYANAGAFEDTLVHRSVSGFVVQSGGFQFSGEMPPDPISVGPAVVNEPVFSNVRGTIAMAKQAGNPNSATSQWFINLADNSLNLDGQNGGFTVFGRVLGDGMQVVDAIASLPTFNLGQPFNELPLRDYTAGDAQQGTEVQGDNLVLIEDIVVVDAGTSSGGTLPPANSQGGDNMGSAGGAGNWLWVFALWLFRGINRRAQRN